MNITQQQEQFSIAYIRAVAATAGFAIGSVEVDDDSVDIEIRSSNASGTVSRPQIAVQLKATARNIVGQDGDIRFPLGIKNFNDLRDTNLMVPRILVVMLHPKDIDRWTDVTEDQLAIRHCSYWKSIRGEPATENMSSVTVVVPRSQIFGPNELTQIMKDVRDGGHP